MVLAYGPGYLFGLVKNQWLLTALVLATEPLQYISPPACVIFILPLQRLQPKRQPTP